MKAANANTLQPIYGQALSSRIVITRMKVDLKADSDKSRNDH